MTVISWRIGILGYYSKNIQDPTEKHLLPRFLTRTLSNAVKRGNIWLTNLQQSDQIKLIFQLWKTLFCVPQAHLFTVIDDVRKDNSVLWVKFVKKLTPKLHKLPEMCIVCKVIWVKLSENYCTLFLKINLALIGNWSNNNSVVINAVTVNWVDEVIRPSCLLKL